MKANQKRKAAGLLPSLGCSPAVALLQEAGQGGPIRWRAQAGVHGTCEAPARAPQGSERSIGA